VTATLVVRLVVRARFLPSLGRYAHSSRARSTASRDAAVSSAGVGRRREGDIPRAYVPASGPPETTSRNARIARVDGCDPIYTLWRHTGNAPLATHTGYASNTDLLYLRAWERVGQADYDQPPITGRTSSSQPHPGRFELADLLRLPGCYRAARGEVPVPTSRPSTPHGAAALHFPIRARPRLLSAARVALAGWVQRLRSQGQARGIGPHTRSYLTNALDKADLEEPAPVPA
jgi:hypothetical protein